jgi:replicative DNA helicase
MLPASRFGWANELPADPGTAKMTAEAKLISMRDGSRDGHRQGDLPTVVTEFYNYLPPDKARAVAQNWGKTCGPPPLTEKEINEYCDRHEKWRNGNFVAEQPVNKTVLGAPDQRNTLSSFVSRLIEPHKQDRTISSGLTELDYALGGDRAEKIMGGYSPGQLVYIVGEKGTGKSILTNHTVVHEMDRQSRGVAYLCPEMSYDQQMTRIFANVSRTPFKKIRNHMLGRQAITDTDAASYRKAEREVGQWPLIVRDDIRSMDDVEQVIETWPKEWPPLEILVVDSLYVLSAPAGTSAGRFAIEANSTRLMALTKKHKLVTLAPCQISRPQGTAATASNWRPTRWSLRDSEALAHHSDIMLLLYREKKSPVLEISVSKGRDGEGEDSAEWLQFGFDGMHSRLKNLHHQPPQG